MKAMLVGIRKPVNQETGESFLALRFELPGRRDAARGKIVSDSVSLAPGDEHPDLALAVSANIGKVFEIQGELTQDVGDDGQPIVRQTGGKCFSMRRAAPAEEGAFSQPVRFLLA